MKSNLLVTAAVTLGLLGAARAQSPDNYGPPMDPHHVVLVITLATPNELAAVPYSEDEKSAKVYATMEQCEHDKLPALNTLAKQIKEKAGGKIAIVDATCFDVTLYVEKLTTQAE